MSGPGDETRLGEFLQSVMIGRVGLLGIERDDFEIVFFAEGEECVARATSRMDAAECGANAGEFFDEGDAVVEVAAAEKDVVEHSWPALFFCEKQRARAGNGGSKKYRAGRNE